MTSSKRWRWLVFWYVLLQFCLRRATASCGPASSKPPHGGANERIQVLIWSRVSWQGFLGAGIHKTPNYLGHVVDRRKWECPIDCVFTADRSRASAVDAVMFEAQPITSYYDTYKRSPPDFPMRASSGQIWFSAGAEQEHYFNLYGDRGFVDYVDFNASLSLRPGDVPSTFTCIWGGVGNTTQVEGHYGTMLSNVSDNVNSDGVTFNNDVHAAGAAADGMDGYAQSFLEPPPPKRSDLVVVFMTTNCHSAGASYRTEYVRELMRHIKVHSYGHCLHNEDLPQEMRRPIYSDHGASMRNKIAIFQRFKFVLAFENNNLTDYVTEKFVNALQAGAVPVYMGAPNFDENYAPGPHSVIRTDNFASPAALAKYLMFLNEHDDEYMKYFEWKKRGLSQQFRRRLSECVFYGSECRICQRIASQQHANSQAERKADKAFRSRQTLPRAATFPVDTQRGTTLEVSSHDQPPLHFSQTSGDCGAALWIRADLSAQNGQEVDLVIFGAGAWKLSLVLIRARWYAQMCACLVSSADDVDSPASDCECHTGSHVIPLRQWQHVAAIWSFSTGDSFFVINGLLDEIHHSPVRPFVMTGTDDKALQVGRGFTGLLDDLVLFNTTVTALECRDNVYAVAGSSRKNAFRGKLAAAWHFNSREAVLSSSISDHVLSARGGVLFDAAAVKPLVTTNPCL